MAGGSFSIHSRKRHQHHVEQDHDLGESVADFVGVGGDVGAEQSFRHDAEREARSFHENHVQLGAVGPLFAGSLSVVSTMAEA